MQIGKAFSAVLALSFLVLLVGCMGVSTSRSSGGNGQQSGNLVLASGSLDFGNVTPNTSKTLTLTATNSGSASVTISSASISTKYFALTSPTFPVTLANGQSATFSITFTPNAAATFNATLTVISDASTPSTTASLSGTGVAAGALGSNPTSLSFGNVNVGGNGTLSETITNTGGTSISVTQVGITGAGLTVSGITTPLTLNSGQSATLNVSFAPTSGGAVSGNLTITSTATNSALAIPVSGTGTTTAVGQLNVSPSTLSIGTVQVGSSGTDTGTVTAVGASVTVTAATANNSVFTIGGFSLPQTIAAGQSANFTITFSPAVAGPATATLTFTGNGQPPTTTETLTGSGAHSVALSWVASNSPNLLGYNVYRGPYDTTTSTCGQLTKINTTVNGSTTYTDRSVTNGSVYCYAATAVNTSNQESGDSNVVTDVQIPAQ